jgi:hypothetical protein
LSSSARRIWASLASSGFRKDQLACSLRAGVRVNHQSVFPARGCTIKS